MIVELKSFNQTSGESLGDPIRRYESKHRRSFVKTFLQVPSF